MVPSGPMKRNALRKELHKRGCKPKGDHTGKKADNKDGKNHEVWINPKTGATTALGIGGHGNVNQTQYEINIYTKQLGL